MGPFHFSSAGALARRVSGRSNHQPSSPKASPFAATFLSRPDAIPRHRLEVVVELESCSRALTPSLPAAGVLGWRPESLTRRTAALKRRTSWPSSPRRRSDLQRPSSSDSIYLSILMVAQDAVRHRRAAWRRSLRQSRPAHSSGSSSPLLIVLARLLRRRDRRAHRRGDAAPRMRSTHACSEDPGL